LFIISNTNCSHSDWGCIYLFSIRKKNFRVGGCI
jgi:hypothetical protein